MAVLVYHEKNIKGDPPMNTLRWPFISLCIIHVLFFTLLKCVYVLQPPALWRLFISTTAQYLFKRFRIN